MSPPLKDEREESLPSRLVRVETSLEIYKEQYDQLREDFNCYKQDQSDEAKRLADEVKDLKEARARLLGALGILSLLWPFLEHQISKLLGW